ncbi:MAG: ferritin family protein [bacterium]
MLSTIPFDLSKIKKSDLDQEILRTAIIAELDAINLYEQLASMTSNQDLKVILLDVAKEEKTHVGEFQDLLLKRDKEQLKELEAGKEEVAEELAKARKKSKK